MLAALEKRLPELTVNQVKLEILRLVAMLHDGHTRVRQETLGNHMLPIRTYFFADGLYVEAGDKQYGNVVGRKAQQRRRYSGVNPVVADGRSSR